jgi:hypothetical protein
VKGVAGQSRFLGRCDWADEQEQFLAAPASKEERIQGHGVRRLWGLSIVSGWIDQYFNSSNRDLGMIFRGWDGVHLQNLRCIAPAGCVDWKTPGESRVYRSVKSNLTL